MEYRRDSTEGRFLRGEEETLGEVLRWISQVLTLPRYWALRADWPDLQQEVLGRLTESLRRGRFQSGRNFRVYVQGIARFTALDLLDVRRREGRSPDPPGELADAGTGSAESRIAARQLARRVLDLATETCRQLFHEYFFQGRSHREIGERLGMPIGTVKSRLFRCLSAAHEEIAAGREPTDADRE